MTHAHTTGHWLRWCGWLAALALLLGGALLARAQDDAITMPDLVGLGVPQAAAELNRAGLRLGAQLNEVWTPASPFAPGTVAAQSVPPGAAVSPGAEIDLTVLRPSTARLIYDDNDLTVVNLTDQDLSIRGLRFVTREGAAASFNATRWANDLRARQCVQVWSVSRNGPKGLPECRLIQNWLSTTNRDSHFWTQVSGARLFEVVVDETPVMSCPAAPPNSENSPVTCDFYLPSGGVGDVLEYIYFTYTAERLVAMNPSEDGWMRFNQTTIFNPARDRALLGDRFRISAVLFGRPDIVANINLLAPGQCILFHLEDVPAQPLPQDCDVIYQQALPADARFWLADFQMEGREGRRFTCAGATEGRRTICVMPR